jgi:queuine tRNA-ribosyltransferase
MADLRRAIQQGCFEERAAELEAQLLLGDIPAIPDPLAGMPAGASAAEAEAIEAAEGAADEEVHSVPVDL